MIKKVKGRQFVGVVTNSVCRSDNGVQHFCQNGHQSTGVSVSVHQFDILRELVTDPSVIEYYENLRCKCGMEKESI